MRSQAPVYIMSPMQRCGTNHLADVLLLHPDFGVSKVLHEDFIFEHADLLYQYGEKTAQRWRSLRWIDDPDEWRRLLQLSLGQGLLSFLAGQVDDHKRLLFKTPDCHNIDKCLLFLPEAKFLVLMRDGRDVVESAIRKWPKQPEERWMRQWAQGSRRILDFMQGPGRESRGTSWELVRFEQLVEDPSATAKGVLEFLGVDERAYDWAGLAALPIRGSSVIVNAQGRVSRETVTKPEEFNPVGRWRQWGVWRTRKFKRVAGRELVELGYESDSRW